MKNIRKTVVLTAAAVLLSVLLSCYTGPKSMMPAKWNDVVTAQAAKTDFSGISEMVLSGKLDGEEGEAVYEISFDKDQVSCTQKSSSFSSEKLDRVVSVALLTADTAVMITDAIQNRTDENSMWQLDRWSLIRNYNFFDESKDTEVETFTWADDLRLKSYTYTAKEGKEIISELVVTFR